MLSVRSISPGRIAQWFSISGRASRAEFWRFACAAGLAALVAARALAALPSPAEGIVVAAAAALVVVLMLLTVVTLSAWVRRLHDRDVSGWWVVVLLALAALDLALNTGGTAGGFGLVIRIAALGGGIALAVQATLPGVEGANGFGPAPLAPAGGGRAGRAGRPAAQGAAGRPAGSAARSIAARSWARK